MYTIFVYLILMFVVSVSSDVYSVISSDETGTAYIVKDAPTVQTEAVNEPMIKLNDQMIKLTESDSPCDFSVNVITEAEEETAVYKTYPIHRAEPNDLTVVVIDELGERKRYFIKMCKRRFSRLRHKKTTQGRW